MSFRVILREEGEQCSAKTRPFTTLERIEMTKARILIGTLISVFFISVIHPTAALMQEPSLDGFTREDSASERRWEEQFRAVPAPTSAREHLRRLTIEPHVAGTKEDYATAIYVRDQMRSYGLPAEIKEYQVWLPYPKMPSVVELVAPRHERLKVREAVVPGDPTSSNPKITPLFNGYSA